MLGKDVADVSGTRDHQVRVQFFWQRGVAPLTGGLTDAASRSNPHGNAPHNEKSGTWVRVAETNAGAHHGESFVPRIGNEVVIGYAHGDIDQPVALGQLYNGIAAPVFAAGVDSGANHPGTLSGVQAQALNGAPAVTFNASGLSNKTLERNGIPPTWAKRWADAGNIRRYHVKGELLTHLQESEIPEKWMLPDAIGDEITTPDPNPESWYDHLIPGETTLHRLSEHRMTTVLKSLEESKSWDH